MEIYRIETDTDPWLIKAYDYVRTDAFCFGQNIPVEIEFSGDTCNPEGILIIEDHKPVAGCRITYPSGDVGKIERVCVIREKQKGGYGRIMIEAAEQWILEKGIRHIVISSQDRAAGFYHKLGYETNNEVDPHVYDIPIKRPAPKVPVAIPKLNLGFSCVLVEKYL